MVVKMARTGVLFTLLGLLSLYQISICRAQLPAVCTNPTNFHDQICCPEPFVGAGACGSLLTVPRGRCVAVDTNQTTIDVRGNWPHYYKNICECSGNFGSFDCGECASGYKGAKCDKKVVRKRRLLNHLSSEEMTKLIDTLYMAKVFPSRYVVITKETRPGTIPPMSIISVYNLFVWVHYYISKNSYVYDFGHGGPGFPIWHRFLLTWFEREIQWMLGGDSDFAIPFWDWSLDEHRMFPFQDHIYGASDENATLIGNFAKWTIVCDVTLDVICDPSQSTETMTRFGDREAYVADYPKWPRREEICKSMTIPIYDSPPYNSKVLGSKSFRNYMEGFYQGSEICNKTLFACSAISNTSRTQLHNQVHNMLIGTFTNVPIAANDPLFMSHHAFVDYILEMWIRRFHGEYQPPAGNISAAKGHNHDDVIVPFLPIVRVHEMLVESTELGWTYESLYGLDLDKPYGCEYHPNDPEYKALHKEKLKIPSYIPPSQSVPNSSTGYWKGFKSPTDPNKTSTCKANRIGRACMRIRLLHNFTYMLMTKQFHFIQQQTGLSFHRCVLTHGKLAFQIPPNCDELIFQNNLILPNILIPFAWYSCAAMSIPENSIPQSNLGIQQQMFYICTLN